ncbi:MAG: hypothetical protein ABIH23_10785 [bacterium]
MGTLLNAAYSPDGTKILTETGGEMTQEKKNTTLSLDKLSYGMRSDRSALIA